MPFVNGKVVVWSKDSKIEDARVLLIVKEDCINF
jgi:hypothetical protein